MEKPQILLTNDDGIRSPGLWAAAKSLSEIGYVHVVAPRLQSSGAGRSMPTQSDGIIHVEQVQVNGQTWDVHALGGTPAQAVQHGLLEILPRQPDLVVSGINYGENVGTGVTISGTVGAALEAAAHNIPSLAASLETTVDDHLSYSDKVDFSVAAYFTAYFARILLERRMPPDVHVLKVDVPSDATLATPWELTRLSNKRYFFPVAPQRRSWDVPARVDYRYVDELESEPPGTDVYALRVQRVVSVTPLSLDLTSRVDFEELKNHLK
jgi:5'-nucleotidase